MQSEALSPHQLKWHPVSPAVVRECKFKRAAWILLGSWIAEWAKGSCEITNLFEFAKQHH